MRFLSLLVFFFCVKTAQLYGQVYLQIETVNSPKTTKIYEGSIIEYAHKDYPKIWRKSEIVDIIPETNLLLLEDNYINPSEIVALRFNRPVVSGIGKKLIQASAVWFVYGGIASLAIDDYTISKREIIIGASAATIGFLVSKLFGKRKMKIGKRKNLRIVDIRM
jgi:hypothetical protein